ncbi:GNAT family N-acetyltransferase [Cohnella herbarum]|uniref:GNAT family N-acetyltransferase n=1 Tax=Cohnella herbarum TaxID=2728023 RepID=A0A7Z2VQ79_9BACL|nr:GNAT family N-acetyltransferase [Cohnella herbarum]QJD87453.1 GNAT family N-acetyltransferase [Cohnella herbarum]
MIKPTTIRAMRFILYLKLAMFLVMLVVSLANTKDFSEVSGTNIAIIVVAAVLPMGLMLFAINKRKMFLSLLLAFVVFLFTRIDPIQMISSLVLILLFFLKPTRDYFRGVVTQPVRVSGQASEAIEVDADEAAQAALADPDDVPAKSTLKLKKDPEVIIREATPEDADTVYALMMIAFEEYRTATPPSSALAETDESVSEALRSGNEFAAILFEDDTATAMVRFKYDGDAIYFFRLSVVPNRRRRGYAKQLVKWIERQGVTKGLNISRCKVRQSVQNNLVLYQDMGYEIVDQELIVRADGTIKTLTMEKQLGV